MYLPILTYHRLLPEYPDRTADPKRISVSQDQFRSHLGWLARLGYTTVSLADYPAALDARRALARRSFAITFDDGYEEVLTLALPVLKEFGFTATVFAVAGQLGGTNAWDDGKAKLLTVDQYRTLLGAGITIGAHTCRHVHLTQVDANTARQEISESKIKLESALGKPVRLFAYPYGEYNAATASDVKKAGFDAGFACDRAPQDHLTDRFALRRVVVFPRNSVWEILWKVQRGYPAYQDWKRRS
jgi:peptidoglycan/xylan/chitin deacetylase (PgdA/CDA1 family)